MTGMSVSQVTESTGSGAAVTGLCLGNSVGLRYDMEVAMKNVLTGLLAVAVVAAVVVGGAFAAEGRLGTRSVQGQVPSSPAQGLMPEVVSTAEMPRLVMPTVEVRAFQTVAMSEQSLLVN